MTKSKTRIVIKLRPDAPEMSLRAAKARARRIPSRYAAQEVLDTLDLLAERVREKGWVPLPYGGEAYLKGE